MKPRLRYRWGFWHCFTAQGDTTLWGRGATPFQAWMNWLKLSLSRYDFESQA